MNINLIANNITDYIIKELTIESEKKPVITYGLELLLVSVIKVVTFVSLTLALGIFVPAFIALLIAGVYRLLSGGYHFSTFTKCLLAGLITFSCIGLIAKHWDFLNNAVIVVSFFICLAIALRYAPLDCSNKRIADLKRSKLKILSLIFIFTYFISVEYIYARGYSNTFLTASVLGVVWQSFSITPVFGRLTGYLDKSV